MTPHDFKPQRKGARGGRSRTGIESKTIVKLKCKFPVRQNPVHNAGFHTKYNNSNQ
jgi:hypothetical protein